MGMQTANSMRMEPRQDAPAGGIKLHLSDGLLVFSAKIFLIFTKLNILKK